MKTNLFTKTLVSLSVLAATGAANAAAFQLAEVSTSGLGLAYAGNAAVADNASVVATNPALMTKFKSTEISVGGVYVNGNVNITNGSFKVPTRPVPLTVDAKANDIVPSAVIPNLYVVAPINDRFVIGGGINVNYGLKSEFDKKYNAGVFAGKTELSAVNYNLSGSYNIGYGFSAGLGLNAVHAKAELERHFGITNPTAPQGIAANLKGETWGFGWNAGLTYDFNENNRIGVAYHSPVNLKFKGKYFDQRSVDVGGQEGATVDGKLNLELPAFWEVSTYHKLTDKLAVQFSYKRTDWSSFKKLEAVQPSNGLTLLDKEENFSDNSRVALGVSYDVLDSLTLRAGIAYDKSASVETPSISIPDTDRTWYSLGATYHFTKNLSVDVAYAHLRGKATTFTETQKTKAAVPGVGVMPVTLEGTFNTKSSANLYGLNLNYRF